MTQPLTLSQFTAFVGSALRREPALSGAWVAAELSDVRSSGGHCYMELVEKDERGATVAKMRATVWASQYFRLRQKFLSATGREIASGLKVLVCGSASHHAVYGLSFNITDIDPSYTLGDIERVRREILERLTREGIAGRNRALPLALNPQRIAVISAQGAAGYGDFIKQLTEGSESYAFYPHLFEAVMQGERTSASVRAALERIEMTADLWDCVVIIRGGGATTDLNGFDDYDLARAVALFPLPVIVGIGHERDRTVLDELAHTRCKTPTAVAAFLRDSLAQCCSRTAAAAEWIRRYVSERLNGEKIRLSNIETLVPGLARTRSREAAARLQAVSSVLPGIVRGRLDAQQSRLTSMLDSVRHLCRRQTDRQEVLLASIRDRMKLAASARIAAERARLQSASKLVEVLSPADTLRRGYSITRVRGKALRSVADAADGDLLETTLPDGTLLSQVKKQNT